MFLIVGAAILQFKFNVLSFTPNTVTEGLVGTYQAHDLPGEVTRLLSQGLVKTDQSGKVIPNLASDWEINNDATIFKFKLKSGLKWADGSTIKSSDLELNFSNVDISYPDDKTIIFKLKESYSPFPSLLTKPVFKKGVLMGTGPYKLTKLEISRIFITKLTLKPVSSNFPDVIIRFYPTEKTAITGFRLGEVQSLLGVNSSSLSAGDSLLESKHFTDYGKVVVILYSIKDNVLQNRSVRQALSYNAPGIADEVVAKGPIPPSSWAYNGDIKNYLDNLNDAKAALSRAKSIVKEADLKKEIILTSTPHLAEVGKKVAEAWEKLGFKVTIKIEPGIPQNFQAMLITQSLPQDPDQYFLWHSTQDKTNLTKYSFARVDKDLEDGRKIISEEDRKAKYLDFQKALLEDSPATFLYYPKYRITYFKKIGDKLNQILPLQLTQIKS